MIVIHMDSMKDTARLKRLYDGLDNVTLLYNKSREEIEDALSTNDDKIVMCLGHGSRYGLFSHDWHGNVIDHRNAHLLKDRFVIGIWCYAAEFADRVGLHGYFTSMFISNMGEALCHGFPMIVLDILYGVDIAEVNVFALWIVLAEPQPCAGLVVIAIGNEFLRSWIL